MGCHSGEVRCGKTKECNAVVSREEKSKGEGREVR